MVKGLPILVILIIIFLIVTPFLMLMGLFAELIEIIADKVKRKKNIAGQ